MKSNKHRPTLSAAKM